MNRTIVKAAIVIGLMLPLSGCAFLKSIFKQSNNQKLKLTISGYN